MIPYLLSGDEPKKGQEINFVLHHALDHGVWGPVTKFQVMIAIAALLLLLVGLLINKRSFVPSGFFRNFFESLMLFIRDEMVRPAMGNHHGDRYLPFFCTIFLFVLTMNLLGLVPIPIVGGTATSNIMVTGALAGLMLLVSVTSGVVLHGPGGFFRLFIPGGVPKAIVPLIFFLELLGFLIRHGVLAVRLFANMLAGHLVLGVFLGLIFLFRSWGVAGPSVLLALFVSALELLVIVLQAYVFTLLSVLFVGAMVHPEH